MRRTDVALKAFIFGCEWVQVDPFHAEKNVRLAFTEILFCSSFSSMFVCVHKCEQRHTYIPFSLVYIYVCVCRCACRTWEDLSLVFDVLEDGPISSLQGFRVHGRFVDNIVQSHP